MAKEQSKLRGIRAEKKISQQQLAEVIGVSKVTYSKKERGVTTFTLPEAVLIAQHLGVDISDIFLS